MLCKQGNYAVINITTNPLLFRGLFQPGPSAQLGEQSGRLFQIGGIEALGEPSVNWREQIARLGPPALFAPQPGETRRGTQLQGFCPLLPRNLDCLLEPGLTFIELVPRHQYEAVHPMEFRIPHVLAGRFHRLQTLIERSEGLPMVTLLPQRLRQKAKAVGQPCRSADALPMREPVENTDDSFVSGTLRDVSRAAHKARLHDKGYPLLGSQSLSLTKAPESQFWFAAMAMEQRGVLKAYFAAERVRNPVGKRDRLGHACQRPCGVAQKPLHLSGAVRRTGAGIMPAVNVAVRCVLFGIV